MPTKINICPKLINLQLFLYSKLGQPALKLGQIKKCKRNKNERIR
jgi:hypothetical protein